MEFVGLTEDLNFSLQEHRDQFGTSLVAHVRALSFAFPQENAMNDVANQWREKAIREGSQLKNWKEHIKFDAEQAVFDEDDDDDDDDDDWSMEMSAQAMASAKAVTSPSIPGPMTNIVSPFASSTTDEANSSHPNEVADMLTGKEIPFTKESVDKILEEVRPYLIADGGNVVVQRVDEEKRDVYLQLQGACGKWLSLNGMTSLETASVSVCSREHFL